MMRTRPIGKPSGTSFQTVMGSERGFTLMELLVTLLIVVLLGISLGIGIPAAVKVMHRSTAVSNAQVLSSVLDTAIYDTLRYSSVYVDGSGNVQTKRLTADDGTTYTVPLIRNDAFVDSAGNSLTDAYMTADKQIMLHEDGVAGGRVECLTDLVSPGTYTDYVVRNFRLSYDVGSAVFTGGYTIATKDGSYTEDVSFTCRSLLSETVTSGT